MDIWIIWTLIGLFFFLLEIFTAAFAVICFSVGAFAAAVAAALGVEDIKIQILIFSIFTLIMFVVVRPLALKFFNKNDRGINTGIEAMIGRKVTVIEDIDHKKSSGLIKIDGETWRAICEENSIIESGEMVEITEVNSTILTVKKI